MKIKGVEMWDGARLARCKTGTSIQSRVRCPVASGLSIQFPFMSGRGRVRLVSGWPVVFGVRCPSAVVACGRVRPLWSRAVVSVRPL